MRPVLDYVSLEEIEGEKRRKRMMERKRGDVFLFEKEDFLRRREGDGSRAPVPRREEDAGRQLKRPVFLAPDGALPERRPAENAFPRHGEEGGAESPHPCRFPSLSAVRL